MKKFFIVSFLVLGGLLSVKAQCKTETTINENFDKWKDIDKCWKIESGDAMLYAKEGRIVFYSMMSPKENMYLTTPKIKAGKYELTFDISKNSGDATVEIYSIENTANDESFVAITKKASEITEGKKTFTVTLNKDAHLGIKVFLKGIHQAVYLDNLVLKPIE